MTNGPKIYVDGRPINVGVYGYSKIDSIPLDTIEKIEVIKSPPASKYGANSGRGVILITTKKGSGSQKAFNGLVTAEYGSWHTMKANAAVSGKMDRTDYNISAYAKQSDGYRNSDEETKSMDGRLGWQFDGGRIDWITGFNKSFAKYPSGLTYWQMQQDRTVNYGNSKIDGSGNTYLPNESDEELFNTIVTLDYDKNDWLFNSSVGYSRDHQDYFLKKKLTYSPSSCYQDDRVENIYDFKSTAGKVFKGAKTTNTLSFGVDYQFSDFEQDRTYPYGTTNSDSERKADIEAEKNIFGASLNHDFSWEIFRLQSGLRYNWVNYNLTNRYPQSIDISYENDIDWNISPSVNLLDNANLFVAWSHSNFYMPLGTYTGNMSYDNANTRPENLKPEIYDTIETGWKHQMHKAFNYSLILYYTQVDDKVVSFYDTAGNYAGRSNVGTSIHQGIEVEVDGRATDWLGYRASFTTIDAEWDKGTVSTYLSPSDGSKTLVDLSGKKVNYVPEYEYSLGLDLYPVRNTRFGSVTVSFDLRGFGEQYEDYNNNLKMSPGNFLDAKVSWAYQGFECYLVCSNIFDREWDKLVNATGMDHTTNSSATTIYYPQDGRYIGFGVAYRF